MKVTKTGIWASRKAFKWRDRLSAVEDYVEDLEICLQQANKRILWQERLIETLSAGNCPLVKATEEALEPRDYGEAKND
jgi:hypothetical protein